MAGERSKVRFVLAATLGMALAGCSAAASAGAQRVADAATTAVYNDDYDALTLTFDSARKPDRCRTVLLSPAAGSAERVIRGR